jgi:F-type H+-transporting ATPase subunit delta
VIDTTLAKRYAEALVEIGKERNALEQYGNDLEAINQTMQESRDFQEVLISPVFPKEDKKNISGSILDKMGIDFMVKNFINLLIDKKRIDQLPGIIQAYAEAVDEINGVTRGRVISAKPLSESELGEITQALSAISGSQVIVTAQVDGSLIGGLVAKVGDKVFDGTIRTQLNQLKESLKG